jgi:hypothetical protein
MPSEGTTWVLLCSAFAAPCAGDATVSRGAPFAPSLDHLFTLGLPPGLTRWLDHVRIPLLACRSIHGNRFVTSRPNPQMLQSAQSDISVLVAPVRFQSTQIRQRCTSMSITCRYILFLGALVVGSGYGLFLYAASHFLEPWEADIGDVVLAVAGSMVLTAPLWLTAAMSSCQGIARLILRWLGVVALIPPLACAGDSMYRFVVCLNHDCWKLPGSNLCFAASVLVASVAVVCLGILGWPDVRRLSALSREFGAVVTKRLGIASE